MREEHECFVRNQRINGNFLHPKDDVAVVEFVHNGYTLTEVRFIRKSTDGAALHVHFNVREHGCKRSAL